MPLVLCGGRPVSFAMVDADGDGLRDALITHQSSGIELLRGTPTGYDLSPTIATSGPLLLADMNSDGRLDLVSRQVNFQRIEVRLGDGVGGFGSASVTSIPNDAFALASGQFTADLRPDVVALTREGVVLLMVGDGAGGFGVMHQFSSGLVGLPANGAIAVGDVNGDGLADVVVTDANHAVAGILLGNGIGGLGAPTLLPVGQVPVGVTLADVNADGMQDILTANFNGSSVSVLRNLGGGAFASTTLATTGSCNNVEVADANADGKLDVLAATSTGLRLFVGDGLGGFAAPVQLTSVSTGAVVQSDFDGDGLQDLLSVDSSEGLLDLLPGQTGGSFAALRTYLGDGNFGGTQLLSFDANLDGRPDVLTNAGPPTLNLNLGSSIDPVTYCTAKLNSLGCLPALAWTGNPSASALNGFLVSSSNVRNNKPGILLYGIAGRSATAFSGGRLCVHAPVKRSPIIQSGGSVSGNDCTGVYALDLNAFAAGQLGGNPLAALQVAGTCVTCEFWGRDQGFAPPNNATLSNALEYTVGI